MKRLNEFGRQYIKDSSLPGLRKLVEPYLLDAFGTTNRAEGTIFSASEWEDTFLAAAKEEIAALAEITVLGYPVFQDQVTDITIEAAQVLEDEITPEVLSIVAKELQSVEPFDYDTVNSYLRDLRWRYKSNQGFSGRQVMFAIRAALTGTLIGPCLVIIMILLGKTRCQQRIQDTLESRKTE